MHRRGREIYFSTANVAGGKGREDAGELLFPPKQSPSSAPVESSASSTSSAPLLRHPLFRRESFTAVDPWPMMSAMILFRRSTAPQLRARKAGKVAAIEAQKWLFEEQAGAFAESGKDDIFTSSADFSPVPQWRALPSVTLGSNGGTKKWGNVMREWSGIGLDK